MNVGCFSVLDRAAPCFQHGQFTIHSGMASGRVCFIALSVDCVDPFAIFSLISPGRSVAMFDVRSSITVVGSNRTS